MDADWVLSASIRPAGPVVPPGGRRRGGACAGVFLRRRRALLVSHWEVHSAATVKLITATVGTLSRDRSVGRAEALRRAMLAMIDTGEPKQAHPAYWGLFIVVGDGAAAR